MKVIGISGFDNSVDFKRREFPSLSKREYRMAQGFDSAAALVTEDGIQAAIAEERFSRSKATGAFPAAAIRYCLSRGGLAPRDIDCVAHGFQYRPSGTLATADGFYQRQFAEVYSREAVAARLERHFPGCGWPEKLVQVPHHLAHAASAFYPSGMDKALIFVCDGMGEDSGATLAIGEGGTIRILRQIPGIHSLGILYGLVTHYLGFSMNRDEYKVMGLAPYGRSENHFRDFMDLIRLEADGTYSIPILYRNASVLEKETYAGSLSGLEERFGKRRAPDEPLAPRHMDIAAALQDALQASLLHVLDQAGRETGLADLCLAGGVALNCSANGYLLRSGLFERIFVQPAAGDDGTALGAALWMRRNQPGSRQAGRMDMPFWGPEYGEDEIAEVLHADSRLEATRMPVGGQLLDKAAAALAAGKVLGWFQGRCEFGPRALGNRSILADVRDEGMRNRINRMIKKREDFRPFAPVVPAESATRYFEIEEEQLPAFKHMLFITHVRQEFRRSLPAITHVNGTARVQTVYRNDNDRLWQLLNRMEALSGFPILVNTSFNVDEPIVCSPKDACNAFVAAGLDAMVIGDFWVTPRSGRPA